MTCISKFTDAGIRMQTFKNVHIYLRDCGLMETSPTPSKSQAGSSLPEVKSAGPNPRRHTLNPLPR